MILVDGRETALLPASDRGLHYGDGLFETIRIHAGEAPLLDRHLGRLGAASARIGLPHPGDARLRADIATVLAGGQAEGVLKLILTRGDAGRGYAPPLDAPGRRICALYPLPPQSSIPLRVGVCSTRLGHSPALAGLKHLGRLEQVLGAAEATSAGWDEGLMCDPEGLVIEATRHNIFYVLDGRLFTPPVTEAGVAGVMRALLLETARQAGVPGGERPLRYHELDEVEELFLCNAVAGLRSAGWLAGRVLGQPGLATALRGLLVSAGVRWLD